MALIRILIDSALGSASIEVLDTSGKDDNSVLSNTSGILLYVSLFIHIIISYCVIAIDYCIINDDIYPIN
jgi:hypothetical protein